jgi:CheY-like chemotaxis protein
MPKGGLLRITATNMTLDNDRSGLTGQVVAIRLCDAGMGIPQELLGRIFEPFFTTKPMGKGTGLGLSQVHGFAQQAGGTVTITSKPNEGTEVTLLLPAAPLAELRQQQDGAERKGDNSRSTHQGLRVLVVDDDAAVARLTAGMLEAAGHRPACATDPRVALDLLASGEQFDIVFSDVVMPGGMNGVDLGRAIKHRWAKLPVVLTTGYTTDADAIQREFPLLHKPFTTMELTRAIEAPVRRKASVVETLNRPGFAGGR